MSILLDKWRANSTQKFIPMQASLELTHRCNETCEHCYLDELKDDRARLLSLEEWYHVLDELRSAGVLYLVMIGGEAMLSPLFWHISKRAQSLGFHLALVTNGLKLQNPKTAQKLFDYGFQNVTFSLYSLDSQIHDELTNTTGSHIRTMKAINNCQTAGLKVGVNCLLTYKNIDKYFEVADWCIERNIEIKADPNITPKFSGDLGPTKLRASQAQLYNYYKKAGEKWERGLPQAEKIFADDYVCNVGKGKCAVTPYGDLLTCIEVRESLGSFKEKTFEQMWSSPLAEKWRQIKNSDLEGLEVEDGYSFCEHCPGMAQHEHGDEYKVMKFSQTLAKIKKHVRDEFR